MTTQGKPAQQPLPAGQRPATTATRPAQQSQEVATQSQGTVSVPATRTAQRKKPTELNSVASLNTVVPHHNRVETPSTRFDELGAAADFIKELSDRFIVLSPVMKVEHLPDFYSLVVRFIDVDPRPEKGDVYMLTGIPREDPRKVALTKASLDRIAAAGCLSFHPMASGRLDNASDRYFVHYRSVGMFADFNGTIRVIPKEELNDLRDGHPDIFTDDETRMKQYDGKIENRGFVRGWSAARLAQARSKILEVTESKAMNRVCRQAFGVRHSYDPYELAEKPFAIIATVLTGRHEDPELERKAKLMILENRLRAEGNIFGPSPGGSVAVPAEIAAMAEARRLELHPPPPPGTAAVPEPDGDDDDAVVIECECPDGPNGDHEEGCEFAGGEDGVGDGNSNQAPY